MRNASFTGARWWLVSALCLPTLLAGQERPSADPAAGDTATAIAALRDFAAACDRGVALWGRSLCGPMILVHPTTRFAVANERPPGGTYVETQGVHVGRIPDGIPTANFSLRWVGRQWAMVLLPVPDDRVSRLALLAHESFHRIQSDLGFTLTDPLNAHLDERDGRYWLRAELRALAAALRASGDAARRAASDAVLFRAVRHRLYPGADTLEAALELNEGLCEYTGYKTALLALGAPERRVAEHLVAFERRPTFVRSLGYGTGPALGLLLDRYASGWRANVRERGFAARLAPAIGFTPPAGPALEAAARARVRVYHGEALAAEEDARERARQQRLADYQARLVDGPVLLLRQEQLSRSFNPNELAPFPGHGTIYPTGTFSAEWGTLVVTAGGALVASDFRAVRLPAPADTSGAPIRGAGWTLELAPGWMLQPGERRGDLVVARRAAAR